MTRLSAAFAALLLMICAGRVFWIPPPIEGSKATHQTLPPAWTHRRSILRSTVLRPLRAGGRRPFRVPCHETVRRPFGFCAPSLLDVFCGIFIYHEPSRDAPAILGFLKGADCSGSSESQ